MHKIITLTTDFGLTDEYVGVMKGVILSRSPQASIIDLTHGISHQNIAQAAYIIHSAYRHFPAGTLHVVVVDPGVGSNRRIVLLAAKKHYFLTPDNGILTLFLNDEKARAYEVGCEHLYLHPLSRTFHGRDILAPVAAGLAAGMRPEEVGERIPTADLAVLSLPEVVVDHKAKTIQGAVVHIDHFGNLMTNIHRSIYAQLVSGKEEVTITIKTLTISGINSSYSQSPAEGFLAIFGSRDYLEISINGGSAAEQLDFPLHDTVMISENN